MFLKLRLPEAPPLVGLLYYFAIFTFDFGAMVIDIIECSLYLFSREVEPVADFLL